MKINIAIDGPAASGKTAAAELLAKKIKYQLVDTGIIYRSFTYYCLKNQFDFEDEQLIIDALALFEITWINGHFLFNHQPISDEIYSENVTKNVPRIAKISVIRDFFNQKIREIVAEHGFIVVGRDITSVVLPDAKIKIFLTSSIKARSSRRYHQYLNEGINVDQQEIYQEMALRDEADKTRAIGQLTIVSDAIIVDNSDFDLLTTVDKLLEIYTEHHKDNQ